MPRQQEREGQRSHRNEQDRATRGARLVTRSCDRLSGQFEVSVAGRRRERNGAPEKRIRLSMILHERFSLGSHRRNAVRRPAIGLEGRQERPGKVPFVGRSEHVEQLRDRPIDDASFARQDRGTTSVTSEHEQNGVVFTLEGP